MVYDSLAATRVCFHNALQQVTAERGRSVLHNEFGDVLTAKGQFGEAWTEYGAGLAVRERLAAQEPGNAK